MVAPSVFIFSTTLLACIPLGSYYKKIEDVQTKRAFGTAIGLLITSLICGPYIIFNLLLVLGNVIIIKFSKKTDVHNTSLAFTWVLLLYLHFNVEWTKPAKWLFQTMALRLVGLSFEISLYDKKAFKDNEYSGIKRLKVFDIVNYAYFFVAIHKGPYYSWKAYHDHLECSRSLQGDFWTITSQKLKKAVIVALGYVFLSSHYPTSKYADDSFYTYYGSDYRFLYSMQQLVMYYLEYQIIMMLSTSACTEAGLGLYPVKSFVVPGGGPTISYKPVEIPEGSADAEKEKEDYNFAMLKCFDNVKLIFGPKMRDTIHGWDMPTRYWFTSYIEKHLIDNNHEVRSAIAYTMWALWEGPTRQNLIIALTLWVYIHLEVDYDDLYTQPAIIDTLRTSFMQMTGPDPMDLGFTIMRLFCLFYLTPCFILDDWPITLRYYNSIYWVYHIILLVLIVAAIIVRKKSKVRFKELQTARGLDKTSKVEIKGSLIDMRAQSAKGIQTNVEASTSGNIPQNKGTTPQGKKEDKREPLQGKKEDKREPLQDKTEDKREPVQGKKEDKREPLQDKKEDKREPVQGKKEDKREPLQGKKEDKREPLQDKKEDKREQSGTGGPVTKKD